MQISQEELRGKSHESSDESLGNWVPENFSESRVNELILQFGESRGEDSEILDDLRDKITNECFGVVKAYFERTMERTDLSHKQKDIYDVAQGFMLLKFADPKTSLLTRFNFKGNFVAFLFVSLKNYKIDQQRGVSRERKNRTNVNIADYSDTLPSREREAPHKVLSEEFMQIIRKGIADLSPRQQTAFMLIKLDGLPYREAAEQMDLALGTVKVHCHNAVHKLRAFLKEEGYTGDDFL